MKPALEVKSGGGRCRAGCARVAASEAAAPKGQPGRAGGWRCDAGLRPHQPDAAVCRHAAHHRRLPGQVQPLRVAGGYWLWTRAADQPDCPRFPQLQVTGLDTSAEMVHTAAQNAAAQGLMPPRLDFRHGDVGSLQEAGASFDFAVSSLSLHHWSDPLQGLDEIHRILAPGGQLMLFDLRRDSRRAFPVADHLCPECNPAGGHPAHRRAYRFAAGQLYPARAGGTDGAFPVFRMEGGGWTGLRLCLGTQDQPAH